MFKLPTTRSVIYYGFNVNFLIILCKKLLKRSTKSAEFQKKTQNFNAFQKNNQIMRDEDVFNPFRTNYEKSKNYLPFRRKGESPRDSNPNLLLADLKFLTLSQIFPQEPLVSKKLIIDHPVYNLESHRSFRSAGWESSGARLDCECKSAQEAEISVDGQRAGMLPPLVTRPPRSPSGAKGVKSRKVLCRFSAHRRGVVDPASRKGDANSRSCSLKITEIFAVLEKSRNSRINRWPLKLFWEWRVFFFNWLGLNNRNFSFNWCEA